MDDQISTTEVSNLEVTKLSTCQISPLALQAKNLSLFVGPTRNVQVLNSFNISVPIGVIYGLLGPSGCGKTSFLKCAIGIIKHTGGDLRVFGYPPCSYQTCIPGPGIGYMPQDIALQDDLTIAEWLTFFGKLQFMTVEKIKVEIDNLVNDLDLPDKNVLIGCLSQGQKRRVSFATALVHKPRLLILDEPTVGVDPILREKIWKNLYSLTTNHGSTIIVTTHYIEETKRAHLVGFMRNGQLLIQGSPTGVTDYCQASGLDDAFNILCRNSRIIQNAPNELLPAKRINHGKAPLLVHKPSWSLLALAWIVLLGIVCKKLLLQIKRSPQQLLTLYVIPVLVVLIFCVCVGESPHDIRVAVVNEESPPKMSLDFLSSISRYTIIQDSYDDLGLALESVKTRRSFAVLRIPANFTDAIVYRLNSSYHNKKTNYDFILNNGTLYLYPDVSHKPIFVTTERVLEAHLARFLRLVCIRHGFNPESAQLPIVNAGSLYSNYIEGDFSGWRDFETSGVMITIIYIIACGAQILAVVSEKRDNIHDRLYVSGLGSSHIILSHLLARFLTMMVLVFLVYLLGVYVFAVPSNGSIFWTVVLLQLISFAGMANGILLSATTADIVFCASITNGFVITIFVVSGVLWPFEGLPYWFRWMAYLSPMATPTEALRSLLIRGWGIGHPVVLTGFFLISGWSALYLLLAVLVFHYMK